jgi:Holliday junction resolvase
MPDTKIREAHALYKILEKNPRILKTNPQELIDKLEQLKKGLPLENEFISLALWMKKCVLIHKLDQNQMPKWTKEYYQVPDLFAVFKYNDNLYPVLIEVKAYNTKKLKFPNKYYNKLLAYSRLNKMPLLIAWKIPSFGLWFLFSIEHLKIVNKAYHINFGKAAQENLLSFLLGDFSIHFRPNIKFYIKLRKIEKRINNDTANNNIEEWKLEVEDACFYNHYGIKINKIPQLLIYMLTLTAFTEEINIDDNYIIIENKFIDENPQMIFASQMHSMAIVGLDNEYNPSSMDWESIIFNEKYQFSFESLEKAARQSMANDLVHCIGHIKPKTIPDFLEFTK